MSYRREITTLGRGGSDTTAVALAAALNAERCEIYSDVDGVYSADPRAVPDAVHLPELTHEMLQEMAECGAKVVCAQAVEWARRAGIAIYARATADKDPPKRETVVRRSQPSEELRARAIVAEPNVALGRFDDGALDALLAATRDAGPSLRDLSSGGRGGSFVVPLLNVPDWATEKRRLLGAVPGLELVEGLASVSVVGDGLGTTGAPVARFVAALRDEGVAFSHLTATPLRISASVETSARTAAERALHAVFVPHA
jgi:aspartate kinase